MCAQVWNGFLGPLEKAWHCIGVEHHRQLYQCILMVTALNPQLLSEYNIPANVLEVTEKVGPDRKRNFVEVPLGRSLLLDTGAMFRGHRLI